MAFVGEIAYTLTYAIYADRLPRERASVFGMGHNDNEIDCTVLGAWQTTFNNKFVTFQDVKKAVADNAVKELFTMTVNLMITRCHRLGGRSPHYPDLLMRRGLDTLHFTAPVFVQGPLTLPAYLEDFKHDVNDAMDTMQQAEYEWVDVNDCRLRLAGYRTECHRLIRLGHTHERIAQNLLEDIAMYI